MTTVQVPTTHAKDLPGSGIDIDSIKKEESCYGERLARTLSDKIKSRKKARPSLIFQEAKKELTKRRLKDDLDSHEAEQKKSPIVNLLMLVQNRFHSADE